MSLELRSKKARNFRRYYSNMKKDLISISSSNAAEEDLAQVKIISIPLGELNATRSMVITIKKVAMKEPPTA
jgi:hypothetical protein